MIILMLTIYGLCLGSFVNALVWRIYKVENAKSKPKAKQKYSILRGRSMCVDCGHILAAKDLIPVFSWLSLGGKCRYCRKPIAWQYPLVELITTSLFLFSYAFWPTALSGYQIVVFVTWLALLVAFMAHSVYDLRWYILPDKITGFITLVVSTQLVLGWALFNQDKSIIIGSIVGGLVCFGFFWALFQVSKGKWIGGGDVKLALSLGLLGGGAIQSFLIIFIASLLGCTLALVFLPFKKFNLQSKLPFGPLLIAATVIVYLFGSSLITWYKHQISL